MGNALIFYTSNGNQHIVKGKNVNLNNAQEGFENLIEGRKNIYINPTYKHGNGMKPIAKNQGIQFSIYSK